ncbi:unnamed protein product [Urochloa decumbens]|uniref:Uncharacterized protein n=1 Tax=Urochloa decumbens TaxID=240449 RepID=A0ABC8XYJ5_9POAL
MSPSFAGVSFVGDSSLSPSASVALPIVMSGYHVLVVNGYSRTKDTPNGKCIRSQSFKIGGHRWFIEYYPNGYGEEKASDISFYLVLDEVNNVEPVTAHYTFSFLGQSHTLINGSPLLVGASRGYKFAVNELWSPQCFMKRQNFEKSMHLKNDSFTIVCHVSIMKNVNIGDAAASTRFVVVPPSQYHLYNLLQSQEGTDVTFQVGGEKFAAHRCVFAARSAVFKAQLFGPMKEGTTDSIVRIDDMEAKVFRLLLGYIYCDSVPEVDEELMLQHLLVAADKYDLPRLRLICEYKLCPCINADTVGTMLELAEQHHCQGLKEACLDFLNSPANLQQVITDAGGLDNLTSSSSSVLTEHIAKLASSLKFDK